MKVWLTKYKRSDAVLTAHRGEPGYLTGEWLYNGQWTPEERFDFEPLSCVVVGEADLRAVLDLIDVLRLGPMEDGPISRLRADLGGAE